jgi:hypothetical protein
MTGDDSPTSFEATFRLRIDRETAWQRLTTTEGGWLPGFDSRATVVESEAPHRLVATKDEEPCAGTDIVITLDDDGTGTQVHVVQSGFGDWLPARYDVMAVGWRFIVADLQTWLATGVHPRRHLRRWGDLGAGATARDGGVAVSGVRDGGLASRLGLADGDLLLALAGAPVASLDDLVTVLRVLDDGTTPTAEWVRAGALVTTVR